MAVLSKSLFSCCPSPLTPYSALYSAWPLRQLCACVSLNLNVYVCAVFIWWSNSNIGIHTKSCESISGLIYSLFFAFTGLQGRVFSLSLSAYFCISTFSIQFLLLSFFYLSLQCLLGRLKLSCRCRVPLWVLELLSSSFSLSSFLISLPHWEQLKPAFPLCLRQFVREGW